MLLLKRILFIALLLVGKSVYCQQTLLIDSTGNVKEQKKVGKIADSTYKPRIAIVRSAILPGWGQATNKKYWKIPIVYGALGTSAYFFVRNLNDYKDAKKAYENATDGNPANNNEIPEPYHSVLNNPQRIAVFRNSVRQNVDYSVLFFLAFWGLNVVDAAVDAHLKTFDVNDDLSLQLKPGYSPLANTNGISLVFTFK